MNSQERGATVAARDWDRDVVRYPDPAVEIIDPRFEAYINTNAAVERLYTGARWAEGPVWFGDRNCLLFSDIPNNRILCWDGGTGQTSVYRHDSNNSNGHTRDLQGRLISCEHLSRRVTRTEHDGSITVLADSFQEKPLNAPNDVVVKSDGSIWFTDPGYGILVHYEGQVAPFELNTNVYRLDPGTGQMTVVADDFDRPNGLCFSPDESILYISDTGRSQEADGPPHIRKMQVDGSTVKDDGLFVPMKPSASDGFRVDMEGNIWTSAGWAGQGYDGVQVYSPEAELLGQIHLPEICANVCFGGPKRNRLFMAASQSLYALYVEAVGAQRP